MTAPRVLIVDDNATNIILAQVVLMADGFEIASSTSASEAEEVVMRFKPDLILMDIQMPGTDGLTLTRRFKADKALCDIPIVAFTAYAMRGDEEKIRGAGCDGYLSKPIDVKNFAAQVRSFLRPAGASP